MGKLARTASSAKSAAAPPAFATKVRRHGGSSTLLIPAAAARIAKLVEGAELEMIYQGDGSFLVRPKRIPDAPPRKRMTLSELLVGAEAVADLHDDLAPFRDMSSTGRERP